MNTLLPCVETGSPDSQHSIIWLHGLGADGHDFEPIVDELTLEKPVHFVFPHAPSQPVTINNGMTMPAWYDITSPQIDTMQDEKGIRQSEQYILALIEREIERGVASENIILAGFSQGGAIALHTALRYDKPLAGIMALSTYVPLQDKVEVERSEANQSTPIFMAHGKYDQIIPLEIAVNSQVFLNRLGYKPEFKQYEMEHSVYPEEIDAISLWINECFK